MKKRLFLGIAALSLAMVMLSGCENYKPIGNKMQTGSYTYYYAYVRSSVTGTAYYHINGWAEYGPEGGDMNKSYVGLELHLFTSKDVIYYYEPNLCYILSKQYNPAFGTAIE